MVQVHKNVFYFLNGSDSGAGTRSTNFLFKVGFKYKFDTSDSSNSGHPLKFSTTADGTHGGGSEFTTNVTTAGTPGSAGASTTIEITPETLGIAGATSHFILLLQQPLRNGWCRTNKSRWWW